MNSWKKKRRFVSNNHAVLGLPMRLTISLMIGTIVLVAVLSYLLNPCLFPQRMVVTVTPMITILSDEAPKNISFIVQVNDTNAHPIQGASIIIKGLGGAGEGFTDTDGKAIVHLQVSLDERLHEGYLDIAVKATCHIPYMHQEMIKIVKRTS